MKADKKILVCGAGVAGPACAYWLHRYGYDVVIAEKAKALRDGGQNVDIKGVSQQVIRMMGIVDRIEAANTHEQGQKYLDAGGKVVAVFPKGAVGGLTADFEILRGDFAQILFETTQEACDYRFGVSVIGLAESDDAIEVTFDDGSTEKFAMVICAEGIGSATRQMVLADQTHFRYLGAYMAFFNIPRRPEDDDWAWTVNGVGGTFITLRPGNDHQTTVLMTFLHKEHDVTSDDVAGRRELLLRALQGRGTIADRIRAELGSVRDFYFGPMSQVQASTWFKGRFVMIGDAAHCPTPFTGQGTALALVGAYVLAGEIKRGASHAEAFAAYERLVRPYVEASQKQLSPLFIRVLHVKTGFGIALTRAVQKFFASSVVQRLLKPSDAKHARDVAEDFVLPDYS